VEGGLREISNKSKGLDEFSKKLFKGFTVRVKKLEKMMMASNKKGGARRTKRNNRNKRSKRRSSRRN